MALSKLAVRRLTKLADYMESLPRSAAEHFHMEWYAGHDAVEFHSHFISGQELTTTDLNRCGTTACAAGWATTIPSFRRAGLRLVWGGHYGEVFLGELDSAIALETFFHIGHDEAYELFGADTLDKTPWAWAARCRKFIRDNTACNAET